MSKLTAAQLTDQSKSRQEWALFDIREAGEIHTGHIPGATPLPRRTIELRIHQLVYSKDTPICLYDEGGPRAELAADTLRRVGYQKVFTLDGGTVAWQQAGGRLVEGKNVPSKTFAEDIFKADRVPQLTAEMLHEWIAANKPFVLCDIRTPEEHVIGHVPGAVNVPGVELATVAWDLEQKRMPIVVHCAGRTRSIIACQTLRVLGSLEAYALKNGTMGWTLAGYGLDRGPNPESLGPSPQSVAEGAGRSRRLAENVGATYINADELASDLDERELGQKNCYAFDVRLTDHYAAGHIKGTISLPGGQAILFADDYVAVRNGPVVLVDDNEAQASMTAYWFRRLGYPKVHVLAGGIASWVARGGAFESGRTRARPVLLREARQATQQVDVEKARALIGSSANLQVIDVNTSKNFSTGHIATARWMPRGWLEVWSAEMLRDFQQPILVVCQNGLQSTYAAWKLQELGYKTVYVLSGGLESWKDAGLALEQGAPSAPEGVTDVIKSPYERTKEDMIKYLEWEQQLAEKSK